MEERHNEFGNVEEHLTDIFGQSRTEDEKRIKMENLQSLIKLAREIKRIGIEGS
ncbi:hypothetical protein [Bacillus sp. UNC438CL73TsuS30]|uniref:hypothetical protein n=1 Tax=Bacillus sp. UNC438CL73TsuS30 TaxID=1340434 RepID=UPI000AEBE79D|nr:hypothetical protein [Bacillus sp. UNC438CL73TsuS30]